MCPAPGMTLRVAAGNPSASTRECSSGIATSCSAPTTRDGRCKAGQFCHVIVTIAHRQQPAGDPGGGRRLHPLPYFGNQLRMLPGVSGANSTLAKASGTIGSVAAVDLCSQHAPLLLPRGVISGRTGHQEDRAQQSRRIALEKVEQHVTAHRHAADHGLFDGEMVEQVDQRIGITGHRRRPLRGGTLAKTRQIGTDDAIAGLGSAPPSGAATSCGREENRGSGQPAARHPAQRIST